MNEDTIVIALHGSLTPAERVLAQSPGGADQVREFHRHLFGNRSATLLHKNKSITGMEVRDTTAEIEPTTGSVVHLFTTGTVGEEFLLAPGGPTGAQAPGHKERGPAGRPESSRGARTVPKDITVLYA